MSELISGKEAKLAWANGKKLQIANTIVGEDFYDMDDSNTMLNIFDLDFYQFRLKPRTITLNNIEVPCNKSKHDKDDIAGLIVKPELLAFAFMSPLVALIIYVGVVMNGF